MKITIDTKEDSHEEIKKVISLLTHLIGETPKTNDIFNNSEPSASTGDLFSIFDNPPAVEPKKPEDQPKVILY